MMTRGMLDTMYSAQHFEREVPMNMTGLAELLQSVQDVIFTVAFRKKVTEQHVFDLLEASDEQNFQDEQEMTALAKSLVKGETSIKTCQMVRP